MKNELHRLAGRYCAGLLTDAELQQLNQMLRGNPQAQQQFLEMTAIDARLRSIFAEHRPAESLPVESRANEHLSIESLDRPLAVPSENLARRGTNALVRASNASLTFRHSMIALLVALPLTAVFLGLRFLAGFQPSAETLLAQSVATIGELKNCRLNGTGKQPATGSSIKRGQRFDLASGAMQIRFASGALAMIHGPAIFDISSRNSGFLTAGKVNVSACSSGTDEFSLRTSTASAVNNCTDYDVEVALTGRTRFDVSKGSLRVDIPAIDVSQRLESGGTIEFASDSANVITLIESGDETPAFHFPTIPSPSSSDLADLSQGIAKISSLDCRLYHFKHQPEQIMSGRPEVLLDGKGQSGSDRWQESLLFDENTTGLIVVDLGKLSSVTMINTYSWHRSDFKWYQTDNCFERAPQKYALYGSDADELPPATAPYTNLGWDLIANVNTDDFFHTQSDALRPAQQASSIRSIHGAIGSYRYLLWVVQPSIGYVPNVEQNTMLGELDVYGE